MIFAPDNPFNQHRHLISQDDYKERPSAALTEWLAVMAFDLGHPALPASGGDKSILK
jgi:hypothetical protein